MSPFLLTKGFYQTWPRKLLPCRLVFGTGDHQHLAIGSHLELTSEGLEHQAKEGADRSSVQKSWDRSLNTTASGGITR